jgi:hypothetical protein
MDVHSAPCIDLELVCGVPGLHGVDSIVLLSAETALCIVLFKV